MKEEKQTNDVSDKLAILDSFAEKLCSHQVDLDSESQQLLDDNFWALIDDKKVPKE